MNRDHEVTSERYAFLYLHQFIPFEEQTKEDLHKLDEICIDYICAIEDRKREDREKKIKTKQEILDAYDAVMSLHRRLLEHFRQTEKNCYTCCSLHFCDYTRKHYDEFHKAVEEHREIEQEDLHDHCCDQWEQAPSMKEILDRMKKHIDEAMLEMLKEKQKIEELFPVENMLSEIEQRQKLNEIRQRDSSLICEIPNVGDRIQILFTHVAHRRKQEFLQKDLTFLVKKVRLHKSKIDESRDRHYLTLYSDGLKDTFQVSTSNERWIITERNTNKSE